MKEYEIKVTTVTTVYVEANNEEEARKQAATAYWEHEPDDIQINIIGQGEDEVADVLLVSPNVQVVEAAVRALERYDSENVDAVVNEETGMIDIIYHSDNNSFPIVSDVADAARVDKDLLADMLDVVGVGHCW